MENLLHIFWALLFQSYHLEKLLVVKRFSCYRRGKARQLLRKIIKTYTHTFSSLLLHVLPWEPKAHSSLAVAGARYLHCNSPCFTNTNLNIQRVRGSASLFCRWRAELERDGDLPKVTQKFCGRVGNWSLTCLLSFQCLNPPTPVFSPKFYTKTVFWDWTLTVRSLPLFDISTPGKKHSYSPTEPNTDKICFRAHGYFSSVPFFLKTYSKSENCISASKGMCNRDL